MFRKLQIIAILIFGSISILNAQEIVDTNVVATNKQTEKVSPIKEPVKSLTKTKVQTDEKEYHEWEVYGGYQFAISDKNQRFNGFKVSATGNFHKYFGGKLKVSGGCGKYKTLDNNFDVTYTRHQFMGGI